MSNGRYLVVMADDFGIGPATSAGILDLAGQGLVTASVLLVNSPHAESAVRAWRESGVALELGWHPCLTLDRPVSPPGEVPSLVDQDGLFLSLGRFLGRLMTGRVREGELVREMRAQLARFRDLTGGFPTVVNSHHHVQVFPPVGSALRTVLVDCPDRPYVRNVRESWRMLLTVPGARVKRAGLSTLGRLEARRRPKGMPGNAYLAGVTDPACVGDPEFFERWLANVPGDVVELSCHPGHDDPSLVGRHGEGSDALRARRVREFSLLSSPGFTVACERAGFQRVAPGALPVRRATRRHRPLLTV